MEEKPKKHGKIGWMKVAGVALMLVSIVLVFCFLVSGEIVIDGKISQTETNTTIMCKRTGETYPYYSFAGFNSAETEIDIIFGTNELSTIGLKQNLYYSDAKGANMSDANNHAAVNLKFQSEGMTPDSLNAAYTVSGNRFGMSLFASGNDINGKTAKYFLLEDNLLGASADSYVSYYEGIGFSCIKTE